MQLETKDYIHFRAGDRAWSGDAFQALPGDYVTFDGDKITQIRRAKHRIVGVLELASKVRYGMTTRGSPIYRFTPWNEAYPPFFVGCSSRDNTKNVLAQIEFVSWDAGTCPRGNLVRAIGTCGDLAAEETALLLHADWPRHAVNVGGLSVPSSPTGSVIDAFHIDPPGCRDVDDAISIIPAGDGFEVHIHIADVASWLNLNPWLLQSLEAGQTLYRDGAAVRPMFPAELSEGLLSLLKGEERDVLSLILKWDGATLSEIGWKRQRIRVTKSYTYETASQIPCRDILSSMLGTTDPHEWIEKLMLLYNRAAAARLRAMKAGILRRHTEPDKAKLEAYRACGFPAERLASSAGEYCGAAADNVAHWGLECEAYCHATSPIRRAADCYNQMILMGFPVEADVCSTLNAAAKRAKAYERDLAFVRALLSGKKMVDGIAGAGRVWIPAWGRLIKGEFGDGPVSLAVFCDAGKRNWKRRMVLQKIEG